jgi:tetratricopeptide (TPR) repeat protein
VTARVLAIALFLVGGVAAAAPAKVDAQRHVDWGNQLYQSGDYAGAIEELKAAWALDPRPDLLYAIGQAARKKGDCAEAVKQYQAYLETNPSAQRRQAAQMQIDRCKEELAAASPAPAPVSPAPEAAQPAPVHEAATAPAPTARTPLYKKWWLWTTIVGVAAVGVGVGVGVALSQKPSFDPTLPDFVVMHTGLSVRY